MSTFLFQLQGRGEVMCENDVVEKDKNVVLVIKFGQDGDCNEGLHGAGWRKEIKLPDDGIKIVVSEGVEDGVDVVVNIENVSFCS